MMSPSFMLLWCRALVTLMGPVRRKYGHFHKSSLNKKKKIGLLIKKQPQPLTDDSHFTSWSPCLIVDLTEVEAAVLQVGIVDVQIGVCGLSLVTKRNPSSFYLHSLCRILIVDVSPVPLHRGPCLRRQGAEKNHGAAGFYTVEARLLDDLQGRWEDEVTVSVSVIR